MSSGNRVLQLLLVPFEARALHGGASLNSFSFLIFLPLVAITSCISLQLSHKGDE